MKVEGLASAVFGWLEAVRDGPLAVVKQRPIDEPRPNIEDVNELARQAAEPPGFVGMHHQSLIAPEQAMVEVNHTAAEFPGKDADAARAEHLNSLRRTSPPQS